MKHFVEGSEFSIVDLTHVFTKSDGIVSATISHNSEGEYTPQVNLILLMSLDNMHPSFFRLVPGSIRDVSTIPLTLKEAGVKRAILIGDKAFYSAKNVEYLEDHKLGYVLPIKRTSSFIDYGPLETGNRKNLDGFFLFDERVIWYYERKQDDNKRLIVFQDERLRVEEEKDMITRVDKGAKELNDYYKRQYILGTIGVFTNTDFTAQRVFELLKGRIEIELLFDTFKNLLHADRSYMRDDIHLEGWMMINFVSLLLYYKIYEQLTKYEILKKYSPMDVIIHLSRIHKLRIGGKWIISEIPKASRKLLEDLDYNVHIT